MKSTLQHQQKTYNDIHRYYRAHIEHLFASLWSWKCAKNAKTVKTQKGHIPNVEEASKTRCQTTNDAHSITKYGFLVRPHAQK